MRRPALALVLLLALAASGDAFGRAGGGNSFSGGSSSSGSSSGSSSSYGGSSSSDGDGGALMVWLLFEHPTVGVPLILVFVGLTIYRKTRQGEFAQRHVSRTERWEPPVPRGPEPVQLAALLATDPGFSAPLFLDMARLVHTRAWQESRALDVLAAYLAPGPRRTLEQFVGDGQISDVCIGAAQIAGVRLGEWQELTVRFTTNVVRTTKTGKSQQFARIESWRFGRRAGGVSLGPDRMQELRCPSCGNPSETRTNGTCTRCDQVVNDGRLMWIVRDIEVVSSEEVPRIALHLGGGVEPGTRIPTRPDPDLGIALRKLSVMQPDFSVTAFRDRAKATFFTIQEAWSAGRREDLRPLESDFLFQQHRYWLERYAREGMRNRCGSVSVSQLDFVKITIDGYVVAVTVRIFASMFDWTEDRSGQIVGGSQSEPRAFTEYWTFVRSVGAKPTQASGCPSCGAALDRVSEAGVCGYCEAKITSGTFDWVLNDIQQDEVWRG